MNLYDLFTKEELQYEIDNKYISIQYHPDLPLVIYNYTSAAQFSRRWNDVTMQCRGLVADLEGNIISRPFKKFFNYGEGEKNTPPLTSNVIVTDKVDGSLGVAVSYNDDVFIATRGSFTSPQAIHATEWLKSNYPDWKPVPGYTYLFEVIYPENRIVVNYQDSDELILLGTVDNEIGSYAPATTKITSFWPGKYAQKFNYKFFGQVLKSENRKNVEGFVAYFLDTGKMLKVKQADYVQLHKVVTNLSEQRIWEALRDGTFDNFLEIIPDEYMPWVKQVCENLNNKATALADQTNWNYMHIMQGLVPNGSYNKPSKKEFAIDAKKYPNWNLLFMKWEGQTQKLNETIWKIIKPVGNVTPFIGEL